MSYNLVDPTTGDLTLVAGGTLWADSPIGSILPYGGASAPSGWFLCQGQAVSRTTYSELFAVIGTAFGSGDGSTTFNLPDFRNKTAMGGGTLGASSEGALPNITGGRDNTLSDMIWMGDGNSQGAIKHGTPESEYQLPGGGALGSFAPLLFDASKSSNLYKNNQSYVEPSNVRVNYIIKAKMCAMPSDFMSKVDEAVEEVCTDTVTSGSTAPITSGGVYASKIFYKTVSTPSGTVSAGGVLGNNVSHGIDESKFTVIGGSFMVTANSDAAKVWGNVHSWSSGGKVYYTYHSDIAQTVSGIITLYYVAK